MLDAKQIVVTIGEAATAAQPSPRALLEPSGLTVLARNRDWVKDLHLYLPLPQSIAQMLGRRCQPEAVLCTSPWTGRVGIQQ